MDGGYESPIKGVKISEWNEGMFFTLRLHDTQQLINYAKINPLAKSPSGEWNYKLWVSGVNILYGEGNSKYTEEEKKEIEGIRKLIDSMLEIKPVHKQVIRTIDSKKQVKYIFSLKNWKDLKGVVETYENLVKFYNDEHGLSTRNKDNDYDPDEI